MGERGPRPKIPELARLDGNPGNRPIVDGGVEGIGTPEVPQHLPLEARELFARVVSSMPPRVYTRADQGIIEAYCMAWWHHRQCVAEVSAYGFEAVYEDDNGVERTSRWLIDMTSAANTMASLGDRLGLNPKARAALNLGKQDRPQSKFAGLVGRTQDAPPVSSPLSSNLTSHQERDKGSLLN